MRPTEASFVPFFTKANPVPSSLVFDATKLTLSQDLLLQDSGDEGGDDGTLDLGDNYVPAYIKEAEDWD